MKCRICNSNCGSDLCDKCAENFLYDEEIGAYRLNKHKLIHEHKRESRLRKILKDMFGAENVHEEVCFDWCINPETGVMLRFDFLVQTPAERFLIEFNGEQHYHYNKYFFKNKTEFNKQRERDKVKVTLCKAHDIPLIVIPYNVALNEEGIWKIIRVKMKQILRREKRKK